MAYKDDVPQTEGIGRYSGVFITNPGMPHVIQKPGEKGKTVFRIYPEVQNGQEMPWRMSADPCDFSYWMFSERLVRMAGINDKFTCITAVKGQKREFQGPIDRFLTQMHNTIKNAPQTVPQEWLKWVKSYKEGGGGLPRTEMGGFLQGALVEEKGKKLIGGDGRSKPMHPVLLMLTRSAREGIEKQANTEVANYTGAPDDYSKRFASGDVCSLAGGRLLQLTFIESTKESFAHYQVNFLPQTWNLTPAKQMVVNEYKPWEKLIRYLTEQEQLDLLVQYFPPEAVDFVFGESNLADKLGAVRGKWRAYLQARSGLQPVMPQQGYQHPPQQPQQPPQPQQQYVPPQGQYTPPSASTPAFAAPVPPPLSTPPAAPGGSFDVGLTLPDIDAADSEFDFGGAVDASATGGFLPDNAAVAGANTNPPVTAASASVPFNAPPPAADPTGADERAAIAKARIDAARKAMGEVGA